MSASGKKVLILITLTLINMHSPCQFLWITCLTFLLAKLNKLLNIEKKHKMTIIRIRIKTVTRETHIKPSRLHPDLTELCILDYEHNTVTTLHILKHGMCSFWKILYNKKYNNTTFLMDKTVF